MAARQSSRADRAVNPDIFDILGFAECGLAVVHRPDIGAVELVIRERGRIIETVVLAPEQALAVAERLVGAVMALAAAEAGA